MEIGRFVGVCASTPLAFYDLRDLKGIYTNTRERTIKDMTGVDDAYEVPEIIADPFAELQLNQPRSFLSNSNVLGGRSDLEHRGWVSLDRTETIRPASLQAVPGVPDLKKLPVWWRCRTDLLSGSGRHCLSPVGSPGRGPGRSLSQTMR